MRAQSTNTARSYLAKLLPIIGVVAALTAAVLHLAPAAVDAAGPPYGGPTTAATGPAYFGPAPNPFPYCENPTYFDPFPENVTPIGRIDVTGSPNASVTTDDITMEFELTAEGAPGTQYPGFFPFGADGSPGDQPKGVEMASDDGATISLSEPMFYTQWVFTDVDRANEGFFVTPAWSDPGTPGQVAVFGGDVNFDFTGTTDTVAVFNDTDAAAQPSEAIEGRVQVDFLGSLDEITILRDTGSGQSGFAIGGGCSPIGVSKEVTSGPTWNGTGYDVTYTIRVRNNLPSSATLSTDVSDAIAAAASGTTTGTPVEIDLTALRLDELLVDPAFSAVNVNSNTNTSGNVTMNPAYDGGVTDANLIAADQIVPPETEEEFVLTVEYIADPAGPLGAACGAQFQLNNQATLSGEASGVAVVDESDSGADPDPGVDNGTGGVDDATIVAFDCPPAPEPALEIVKTVVAFGTACPTFDNGVAGDGSPLSVSSGETVTYCIAVRNAGGGDATNVVVTDPMAPAGFDGDLGTLTAGAEDNSLSFELTVDDTTPTVNTATVNGTGPGGDLPPVDDTAVIDVSTISPGLDLQKQVVAGPDGDCALATESVTVNVGETVTYCFTLTNTGNVDVRVTEITDETLDVVIAIDAADQILVPGESLVRSLSATATGDLTNIASTVGIPVDTNGDPIPDTPPLEPEDPAAVDTLEADVSVVKGVSDRGPVAVGETVTYTLEIANAGPDAAQGVSLVDTAPEGVVLLTLPDDADWTCTSVPPGPLECAKSTPLPAGDTVTLTYTATVTATAARGVDLVNTVVVSSTTPDPDPTNNTDTETTTLPPPDEIIPTVALPIPVISNPPAGPATPPNPVAPPAAPPSPPLVATGASSVALASTSSLLVLLGAVLWVGARRHDGA